MSKRANILLRGLNGGSGSGVKAFTLAQDRAQLALKQGELNGDIEGGLKRAIEFVKPFIDKGSEKEILDATTLIAGYEDRLNDISSKKRRANADKGTIEARVLEKIQTDFDDPQTGISMRNAGSVFESATEGLDQLYRESYQEMLARSEEGNLEDDYAKYVEDLGKLASKYVGLQSLFDNGQIIPGQELEEFGFVLNTDPKTGEVLSTEFTTADRIRNNASLGRVQAFSDIKGAKVPVYVTMTGNEAGETVARIGDTVLRGGKTWSGRNKLLVPESGSSSLINDDGIIDISDSRAVPKRGYLERPGDFVKADFGYGEDGAKIEKTMYLGQDGKRYIIPSGSTSRLSTSPFTGITSNAFVPRVPQAEFLKMSQGAEQYNPVDVSPDRPGPVLPQPGAGPSPILAPNRPTVESGIERVSTFFDRKNRPVSTEPSAPSRTAGDFIEKAKGFFRKTA